MTSAWAAEEPQLSLVACCFLRLFALLKSFFWSLVGDRCITPVKIKSHLEEDAARATGTDMVQWFANQEADKLADEAALAAQLSPEEVAAVQAADRKSHQVQEHLLAVSVAVAKDAGRL